MLPDVLLRSVLRSADEPEPALKANLLTLRKTLTLTDIDGVILDYIASLAERAPLPAMATVVRYFERLTEAGDTFGPAAVARLSALDATQPPLLGADFVEALDAHKAAVLRDALGTLLTDTAGILTSGVWARVKQPDGQWGQEQIIGPEAALAHLSRKTQQLRQSVRIEVLEGDFRTEGAQLLAKYDQWKREGGAPRVLTGLRKIDQVHGGAGRGDLVLILGFTAQLKTTFTLNWVYRTMLTGRNVGIASIEMHRDDLQLMLALMHSAHPMFDPIRGNVVLTLATIEAATLNREEEAFFRTVVDDFGNNPTYGRVFYKNPQAEVTMADIQEWGEQCHDEAPLSLLAVDYMGLCDPARGHVALEQNARLNTVVRQGKLCAESFAGGEGVVLVSPWQSNREGYKAALKAGGRYDLTAMADANQAERAADLIYSTFLDAALETAHECAIGNLKARKRPKISEQFRVFADPHTRIMADLAIGETAAQKLVDL